MSFIDSATVQVMAGNGGDGKVNFRQEKYVDKGGPDGGDGGRGGNVILMADRNVNTLVDFRFKPELKASNGERGDKRKRHGKNGEDLRVKVPVGTIVAQAESNVQLADLREDGMEAIVAKGGRGGFGNAHFISSTRQAPRVAELGEKGESFEAQLELKLLADIGLVGLPNAGKSTFLSTVSHARPEIADYAFTTLIPHLGIATVDNRNLLIADLPGLIEGASEGKGLGDAFLKHIERTAVLLHLIDAYQNDVAESYLIIMHELEAYSPAVAARPQIVALTKVEGLDEDIVAMQEEALRKVMPPEVPLFAISAQAGTHVKNLLRELVKQVESLRQHEAEASAIEEASDDEVPIIELSKGKTAQAWQVRKVKDTFVVTGEKIEKFAGQTDFSNVHGVIRLRDIMRKMGIIHELLRAGAMPGDTIQAGESGEHKFTLDEY